MFLPLPSALLLLLALALPALASSGDRSPAFQHCLQSCSLSCSPSFPTPPPPLPLPLRLTLWTCPQNCAYTCMHHIESQRREQGERPQQYYGKWPFLRLLGAQEPVSVLASIGNGYAHLLGLRYIRRHLHLASRALTTPSPGSRTAGMIPYLEVYTWVGMNAWSWSSIFHTRDTPWTERMDYFSAALALLYSLYYTLVRLYHLYQPSRARYRTILVLLLAGVFVAHVSYLSWLPQVVKGLPRFDYGYNMKFCLLLGLLHNILWLSSTYLPSRFSAYLFPTPRPKRSWKPLAFIIMTMSAMSLELLDFPPLWGAVDAHATWHLATVPMVGFWYGWLVEDVRDVEEEERRGRGGEIGRGKT